MIAGVLGVLGCWGKAGVLGTLEVFLFSGWVLILGFLVLPGVWGYL